MVQVIVKVLPILLVAGALAAQDATPVAPAGGGTPVYTGPGGGGSRSNIPHEMICPGLNRPQPAPAPSPSPSPSPAPTPGATPAPAPGGPTSGPGLPGGSVTPGPSAASGTPAASRGGTTPRGAPGRGPVGGYRTRDNSEKAADLGALELPWQGSFLPKDATQGYDGAQLTLDAAARGEGEEGAWRLSRKPTLVMVYDPSDRVHNRIAWELEREDDLKAATAFFNLVRVDLRTAADPAASFGAGFPGGSFVVYRANRTRAAEILAPNDPAREVMKALAAVIAADYGIAAKDGIAKMKLYAAREKELEKELERLGSIAVSNKSASERAAAAAKSAKLREELTGIREARERLLSVKPASLVASR